MVKIFLDIFINKNILEKNFHKRTILHWQGIKERRRNASTE